MNKLTLIREAQEKARASRLIQPTPILSQLVEQEIGSEFQSHLNAHQLCDTQRVT